MSFLYFLRAAIAWLLTGIMFIGVKSNGAQPHTVLNEQECLLTFTVLSDAHIEGNNLERFNAFGRILYDADNNSFGNDAMVFLGDNTMNGQHIESMFFYASVARVNRDIEYINVCGNHDLGNGEGDYSTFISRFYGYNKALLNLELDKPYYYRVINGSYFIVLASEDMSVNSMTVSNEQLKFLDETLALAAENNAPAFVCTHHRMTALDNQNYDSILNILSKYKNVFYVYGHTHALLTNGWTFQDVNGVHVINLPRCTELGGNDDAANEDTGIGMQVEVYEDEVVFRARNFYDGVWIESFEQHWSIVK